MFLARLFGVVYVAAGLGLLIHRARYHKMITEILNNKMAAFYGGLFALAAGFVIVTYHNIWESSWTVLVTLIGWLAILKGVMLILLPGAILGVSGALFRNKGMFSFVSFLALVLGVVLCYFGFFV